MARLQGFAIDQLKRAINCLFIRFNLIFINVSLLLSSVDPFMRSLQRFDLQRTLNLELKLTTAFSTERTAWTKLSFEWQLVKTNPGELKKINPVQGNKQQRTKVWGNSFKFIGHTFKIDRIEAGNHLVDHHRKLLIKRSHFYIGFHLNNETQKVESTSWSMIDRR